MIPTILNIIRNVFNKLMVKMLCDTGRVAVSVGYCETRSKHIVMLM